MVFKVDFAKAYDSVRWDYLMDVLKSFGFGDKWCGWIKGSLSASMASVLVNGSPMAEFQFFRGLKQGDPLAPYLFILVMESLHLSFSRTVDVGIFKGIQIGKDFTLSHLFYADDAVFIGEWSDENLSRILHVVSIKKATFTNLALWFGGNMSRIVRSGTSLWRTITSEVNGLKAQGVDILSHCLKRVGNGLSTKFWFDPWIVNVKLCNEFPRLFALELNKSISVAEKLQHSVDTSFRRPVRGGSESAQLESLSELIEGVILSNSRDRWFWDMNGSGTYRVKDVRNMLDDFFLPKDEVATRWLPHLPIKLNVFAWRLYLDRLPTKSNLIRRGIQVGSPICPNCISYDEDVPHIFFKCPLAIEVSRAVCRWWDVVWVPRGSYSEWLSWLLSIKMGSRIKSLFEGVRNSFEELEIVFPKRRPGISNDIKGNVFKRRSAGFVFK
ncbi:RNA-directed DNA polymerase, eukaryota [Tanacetum coccineum]